MIQAGRVGYAEAWRLQEDLVRRRADGEIADTVIVCEHDPVYTVGRRQGAMGNLLDVGEVPVFEVERGGDVTWHGPGQVVVYPIVLTSDLHAHMHRLEDLMIAVCGDFGLEAGRDSRNTGVWTLPSGPEARKLGSIGIACRRWVTWHGLALNVCPDLSYFARIHPCGFASSIMTSMAAEGVDVGVEPVADAFVARVRNW